MSLILSKTQPLSLVIPTYNRANLLVETIESALNQTERFSEIIVVDDGSTDKTRDALENFKGRVKLIALKNGGVQRARNTGIIAAQNPLVALCDSDDLLSPDYCRQIAQWMTEHPDIDACYCNFSNFDELKRWPDKFSLAPDGYFDGGTLVDNQFVVNLPDLYQRTLVFQPLFPTGMVITKKLFRKIGGFNPAFNGIGAEDWEFTLRVIECGNVALCKTPLAYIRRHAGNDSASSIHMNLGEASILEHALENHKTALKHRKKILQSIDARREKAFNSAFSDGDFLKSREILSHLRHYPFDLKFSMKRAIISLPANMREAAWRLFNKSKS